MIIEDDNIDILIIERMIQMVDETIKPVVLRDGGEAIKYFKKLLTDTQAEKPKFVLLDLMMPMVNGFEFLEMYKYQIYPQMPKVPVIILTTSLHLDDKEIATSYEFVKEFVLKPIKRNEILEFIS